MGKTNRKINENSQKNNRVLKDKQRQKMKNSKKVDINSIDYDDET